MTIKPSQGIYANHPSTKLRVGDYVDVAGQRHKVEAIWFNARCSPSGVRLTLDPPVPGQGRWVEGVACSLWVDDGIEFDA